MIFCSDSLPYIYKQATCTLLDLLTGNANATKPCFLLVDEFAVAKSSMCTSFVLY